MAEEKDREKKFAKDFLEKWSRAEREEGPAEEALAKVDEALKANPEEAALWFRRGTILLDLNRFEEALEAFRGVEARAPDHPRLYVALAFALTRLGRVAEAAEAQKKALAADGGPREEGEGIEEALAGLAEDLQADLAEEEAVKGLEELTNLAEGPGIADEEDFESALKRWESEGYVVSPLRETMEKDPDRVRTAFFQFEQNLRKVRVLRDTADALDPTGLERDIERVRALFRTPYQIWRIEAEMATLMEKADARDRARRSRVGPSPPPPKVTRARLPGATNGRPADAAGRVNGVASPGRVNGLGPPTGRVNGLVIPAGKVNGLINGIGRARAGLTNGLTNGVGITNGLAGRRSSSDARARRTRILLIPAVAVLLLSIALILPPEGPAPRGGVVVDGSFADWNGVPAYTQPSATGNPDVDLREYRALWREDRLSLYASVSGTAFRDSVGLDVWYGFLDADGSRGTGYDEGRLGADVLLEIQGGNASVRSTQAWVWAGTDPADWSGWESLPTPVAAAARDGKLELQIDTEALAARVAFSNSSAAVAWLLEDQEGASSGSGIVFGPAYGALIVRSSAVQAPISAGPSQDLLQVTFEAVGAPVNVTGITFNPTLGGSPPSRVVPGSPVTVAFRVDASGSAAGDVVTAEVLSVQADRPATIVGGRGRAYVVGAPSGKTVDGLFAEWANRTADAGTVSDPNVDLLAHAGESSNGTAFFFIEVRGAALEGGHQTHLRTPPQSGPASTPTPPGPREVRPGEDVLRVWYDSNATDAGVPVGTIVADTYVELRGRHGAVRSARAFVWEAGWTPRGAVAAKTGGASLEGSLTPTDRDLKGADYVIEAFDWRGIRDETDAAGVRGLRSTPDGIAFLGSYEATLPLRADGWVRFARGDAEVLWRLPDLAAVGPAGPRWILRPSPGPLETSGYRGTFESAYGSTDVSVAYAADATVLKEAVAFASPPDLEVGEDLVLTSVVAFDEGLLVDAHGVGSGDDLLVDGPLTFVDGRGLSISMLPPWLVDARGSRLDLALRWRGDAIEVRVPGEWLRSAEYPVILDPSTTYTLRNDGALYKAGEQMGFSVAVGDFNGDGYADVLAGAPSNSFGWSNNTMHGAAYIYYGPFSADQTTPSVSLNGTGNAQFGYAVAAGKFNNDAYWDALVARVSRTTTILGPVDIFYGSSSFDTTVDVRFHPPSDPKNFGWAVAAGNIDDANSDDVLIAEPGRDNDADFTADGVVYLYKSPFSADETTADYTLLPSTNGGGQLGRSGMSVGKVDSDAYPDIVVGEPTYQNGANDGRVQYYQGSHFVSGSGTQTPDATLSAQAAGENFGASVAVGTLNGDAYADVVVGAPLKSSGNGGAYLFLASSGGSGISTGASPDVTLASQSNGENFGFSVAVLDFNGDATNDVAVGAYLAAGGGTNRGRVYVFDSPLADQTVDETLNGAQDTERFGYSLAAGKFASDARSLLAIGAYLWDKSGNQNDGRIVVAFVPEAPELLAVSTILIGLASLSLKRRRLVRKR